MYMIMFGKYVPLVVLIALITPIVHTNTTHVCNPTKAVCAMPTHVSTCPPHAGPSLLDKLGEYHRCHK